MFCENCGTKNQDGAVFCENCGTKLVQPQAAPQMNQVPPVQPQAAPQMNQVPPVQPQMAPQFQQPVQPKKPFKLTPQILIPIIAGIVVIIAAVAFVLIGKSTSDPEKVVKKYLDAVADKDWKKAYAMLEVKESDFLNEENYIKMKEEDKGQKISNYKIYTEMDEIEKDAISTTIYYGYTTSGQSGELTGSLQLIKQKGKHMFFFEKWEISESYSENSVIYAPKDVVVTLDGVELDAEEAKENSDGYMEYEIPSMFYGTHKVKAESDIFEDVEDEWYVDYSEANCYISTGEIKDEIVEELTGKVEEIVSAAYTKAFEGKEFSEISSYFSDEKDEIDNIEDYYDTLKETFTKEENGEGFTSFTITEIEAELDYSNEASCHFDVEFDFDYEVNELDWWTDEMKARTGTSNKTVTVTMTYVDGEWLATYASLSNIYFY